MPAVHKSNVIDVSTEGRMVFMAVCYIHTVKGKRAQKEYRCQQHN